MTALNITNRSSVISEHEQPKREAYAYTTLHIKRGNCGAVVTLLMSLRLSLSNCRAVRDVRSATAARNFCIVHSTEAIVERCAAQTQLAAMLMLSYYTTSNSDSLNGGV